MQVHPDDGEENPRGKTEMWHILAAEPGATIAIGFREPISRERLREATLTGEIEQLLNWLPVKPGETYFTPAHTSMPSAPESCCAKFNRTPTSLTVSRTTAARAKSTWNRPCRLPTSASIRARRGLSKSASACEPLVRCQYFVTELVQLKAGDAFVPAPERSQLWICLAGGGVMASEAYRPGEVWLLPEHGEQPVIVPDAPSRFLRTWVPRR